METKRAKIKLSFKLIIPVVSVFITAGLLIVFFVSSALKKRIDNDIRERGLYMQSLFYSHVDEVSLRALHLASILSTSEEVKTAYRYTDETEGRTYLRQQLSNNLTEISTATGTQVFVHFHKAPAVSFLRTWRTPGVNDGGDDISSFRKSVLRVAQTGSFVTGVEAGKAGLTIRGIAPITDNGKYVGSVEHFYNFEDFTESIELSKRENLHIFAIDTFAQISNENKLGKKIGNFILSSSDKGLISDTTLILSTLNSGNKAFFQFYNDTAALSSFPIFDFSGATVGVALYTTNITDIVKVAKAPARVFITILTIALLVMIISIIVSIQLNIARPFKRISAFLSKTSTGDLTAVLTYTSNDEIGSLSDSLRQTFENLSTVFGSTKRIAGNLSHASKYLNSSSQQVAQGASEQAASVEEVSASMEEMSANIEQNADNATTTEKEVYLAAAAVYEGNKSVQKTAELMSSISDKANTINEIAKQTNILALNASVEAANAGEFGEGFAVIAREIRSLAETSRKASIEIREAIQQGVEIANKSSNQLTEIVKKMEKSSDMIRQIVTASREQKNGVDQVVGGIQQLNKVTQQNAAIAEELATNAEQLAGQSENLIQMVKVFKTGDEADENLNHTHKSDDQEFDSVKQHDLSENTTKHAEHKENGYSFELSSDMNDDSEFELY